MSIISLHKLFIWAHFWWLGVLTITKPYLGSILIIQRMLLCYPYHIVIVIDIVIYGARSAMLLQQQVYMALCFVLCCYVCYSAILLSITWSQWNILRAMFMLPYIIVRCYDCYAAMLLLMTWSACNIILIYSKILCLLCCYSIIDHLIRMQYVF